MRWDAVGRALVAARASALSRDGRGISLQAWRGGSVQAHCSTLLETEDF